jgi:hypothetical protein
MMPVEKEVIPLYEPGEYVRKYMPVEPLKGTRPMDAKERGIWIDTEGSISSYYRKSGRSKGSFKCSIHVVQNELAPLEEYAAGAELDGVRCLLYRNSASQAYHAYIQSIVNVDREIRLTCGWIRTANKWSQIRRFYEMVGLTARRREILIGHRVF